MFLERGEVVLDGLLMPRSTTSNPAPSSIIATRFFPMSWMSPFTVPITTVPMRCAPVSASSGRHRHAGLHRVRGEQHLGHEEDPVPEVDADDTHALDEGVVQHPVGRPSALEQDHGPSWISSASPS